MYHSLCFRTCKERCHFYRAIAWEVGISFGLMGVSLEFPPLGFCRVVLLLVWWHCWALGSLFSVSPIGLPTCVFPRPSLEGRFSTLLFPTEDPPQPLTLWS